MTPSACLRVAVRVRCSCPGVAAAAVLWLQVRHSLQEHVTQPCDAAALPHAIKKTLCFAATACLARALFCWGGVV